MAVQSAKAMIIQLDTNGDGTYDEQICVRTRSMKINNEVLEVDSDCAGLSGWVQAVNLGIKSVELSIEGADENSPGHKALRNAMLNGTTLALKITDGFGNTTVGNFRVNDYTVGGGNNEFMSFSSTLRSDGAVTITLV